MLVKINTFAVFFLSIYAILIAAQPPPIIQLSGTTLVITPATDGCSGTTNMTLGSCDLGVIIAPRSIANPTNTCGFVEDVPEDFIATLTVTCAVGNDSTVTRYTLHLTIVSMGSAVPPRNIPGYSDPSPSVKHATRTSSASLNAGLLGGIIAGAGIVILIAAIGYVSMPEKEVTPQAIKQIDV